MKNEGTGLLVVDRSEGNPLQEVRVQVFLQSYNRVKRKTEWDEKEDEKTSKEGFADLKLEDYVSIGPGVVTGGNVSIGRGAMIGAGSTILPTIKIGKHAIVGAGSVVTKDVEDFAVVVGNPAKKIKEITPELLQGQIDRIANAYVKYSGWFKE